MARLFGVTVTFSIRKVVLAVVVAVVAGLLFMLGGSILVTMHVPIATTFGNWLETWGWTLGIALGIWYYFASPTITPTV